MRRTVSHQLILAVGVVTLLVLAVSSFFLVRSQHRTVIAQIETQALELSETIKSSTRYAMLINRPEHVHRIIDTIGRQEGIENVRIFNKEGEIIYSSDKALIGTMVGKQAEACYVCHTADLPLERPPTAQRTRVFETSNHPRSLGVINPIYNEASCLEGGCHAHPETQKVLGVLDVTMSLAEADQRLVAQQRRVILSVLGAILAISAILWILVHLLVAKPVGKLLAATRAVAEGNLSYQLEVKSEDELGQLARSFNEMTTNLREARAQVLQSDKLASLGRLAAGVAHEINNPLTGVLTFSSLLLKGCEEDDGRREDLETIVRETKRCREIVRGLLDFSRQVPPRKTRVGLNDIVRRALAIMDHQLSVAGIRVTTALSKDLPLVRVDSNQIIQVLINLLVNASDAIGGDEGEIVVSTDALEREGRRLVQIKVADSGTGIPQQHLDKIFEPFFTTKDKGGTGLGLAVAWGIINEHGGSISAESRSQAGTTFTIRLPTDEPLPAKESTGEQAA